MRAPFVCSVDTSVKNNKNQKIEMLPMYRISLTSSHYFFLKNKKPLNHDKWTLKKSENFTPSPPLIRSPTVALPRPDATSTSPKSAPPQSGRTLSAPPRLDHVANARVEPRRHRPGEHTAIARPNRMLLLRCGSGRCQHCPSRKTSPTPMPDHSGTTCAGPHCHRPGQTTPPAFSTLDSHRI